MTTESTPAPDTDAAAAEDLDAYVARLVAAAPAIGPDQRNRLRRLLRPPGDPPPH